MNPAGKGTQNVPEGRVDLERGQILRYVIQMLEDITADWDVGIVAPETSLGELGLESINLVYLIAEIQYTYGLEDFLFRRLTEAGISVNDLQVDRLVNFVVELVSASALHGRE
jgi:hypothetical protein